MHEVHENLAPARGGKTFGPRVEINPAYDPCNCCTTFCLSI